LPPEGRMYGVLETIKICFRFEPKQTETQSVSVVFRFVSRNQKTFFSVCFSVSDRYRNNRNKPKKSPKNVLYEEVLETVNFFSRFEPKQTKTQSVSVVFRFAFSRNPKFFFCVLFRFVVMLRTGIKTTETNRTYGMGN
jgi:hypothetical protein